MQPVGKNAQYCISLSDVSLGKLSAANRRKIWSYMHYMFGCLWCLLY